MNKFLLLAAFSILAASAYAQPAPDASFDPNTAVRGAADAARKLKLMSQVPPAPAAEGPGMGSYSDGYRMGMLSKFSVKGWVNKSGEGELLLGQDSSIAYRGTGDSRKMINPWRFSSDKEKAAAITALAGQYVVVRYHQVVMKNPLERSTDYELMDISPVETASKPKEACTADVAGANSEGFRVARVVKASTKGVANKSYEIMVQVGGAGNEFHDMSVSSEAMYECALRWLKSGGKAKIWYKQSFLFNPLNRSTGYDIVKIEPMPSLD